LSQNSEGEGMGEKTPFRWGPFGRKRKNGKGGIGRRSSTFRHKGGEKSL